VKKLRELSLRRFNDQAITENENCSWLSYNSARIFEIIDLC
jgi:hypothetical protein